MHRQAMLVSLSLSPASTAAKNDKHWAFLDEIDAPQWADLKAEEALAKAGTIGDDPWFYHSHWHHEVPLTEITGGQASDVKETNASVRTPNFERKKNRGSSKAKLAFDGGVSTVAKCKEGGNEDKSPRGRYNDTFGGESPRVASPVHCKSPEKFLLARRFMSSATSDDYVAGKDRTGVLGNLISRRNMFENQTFNDQMSMENDMPVLAGQSAEDEEKVSLPWQDNLASKLKDTSRLRKSLGSALRVKVDDSADNLNAKLSGKGTRPKSRLRQSVQLETTALSEISISERDRKKDTASLRNEDGPFIQTCLPDRISAGDANARIGLEDKLGVNSSVQAFDDIRKMRKSWGSALRVKVSDGSPVAELGSKDDVSPVCDKKGECSPVQVCGSGANLLSVVDTKGGSAEKSVPGVDLPEVVHAMERRAENPVDRKEPLDSVQELVGFSSKLVAVAKKAYRRSVSFDNTPGSETGIKAPTSSRSNLAQQKQGTRASSVSRLNLPAQKPEKVIHLSKGGKENSSLHSISKLTKLNPEPATRSPRKIRQTGTRMSMPSLTYAAHARAAMGANGGTVLKPSGNSVLETNRLDSIKSAASAAKKSVGGLDNGSRKKTEAIATNAPAKTITRQSILRSSMPVFSAAKQGSKALLETRVAASKQGCKTSSKTGNGDSDLAALLAEHNRKFRPKPTYEPRMHSVKDIREWEARTGQLFYNLLPAERERANQEISAAKQTQMQRPK